MSDKIVGKPYVIEKLTFKTYDENNNAKTYMSQVERNFPLPNDRNDLEVNKLDPSILEDFVDLDALISKSS